MKQTAVEFYHEEMLEMERKWQMQNLNFGKWKEMAVEALRKAKEIEKEQISNAYVYGSSYGIDLENGLSPNNYYNETFNK